VLGLSLVAAAVAALAFAPARARLRRTAERLVRGDRPAPEAALRLFESRLSRAIPLDELLLQTAETLRRSLALGRAEVWTGGNGQLELAAADPYRPPAHLTISGAQAPMIAREGVAGEGWARVWLAELTDGRGDVQLRIAPAAQGGELLGLLVVERPPDGEPFTERDEEVLAQLGRQIGLALRNARLDSALQASLDELRTQAGELRASRARLVAVADAERRRIERDLHDGAQQHLVGLAVKLRLARELSAADPAESERLLSELAGELDSAVDALRNLAHGVYPPLLMDRGLGEALAGAAARSPVPARVRAEGVRRYRPEVEAAVYFCCLEALQNAAKHAGPGAEVTVRLAERAGSLVFEVTDSGAGFDPAAAPGGTGLTNMRDRLGAIGGTLSVASAPRAGTRVEGTVPLATG
jgi:signal transduction histidine kinase